MNCPCALAPFCTSLKNKRFGYFIPKGSTSSVLCAIFFVLFVNPLIAQLKGVHYEHKENSTKDTDIKEVL